METQTAATATGATPGAGATPAQATTEVAAAGATPAAAAGQQPAPATKPATGEEALGDAGKAVLSEARREAREAKAQAAQLQEQLEALQTGTQTEHERAINQAKREAKAEADGKWVAHIRAAEVRGALRAAGIVNDEALQDAVASGRYANLKVTDDGTVEGVTEAVEAHKQAVPQLFTAKPGPRPDGAWDGAAGGTGARKPLNLEESIGAEIERQFKRP